MYVHTCMYIQPQSPSDDFWRRKWQRSMRKVLSLPDAMQVKRRAQVRFKIPISTV